jgi:hypothetical protein
VVQIKLGRSGASPALVSAVQAAWRQHEVVKLRIHDDKVGAGWLGAAWCVPPRPRLLITGLLFTMLMTHMPTATT